MSTFDKPKFEGSGKIEHAKPSQESSSLQHEKDVNPDELREKLGDPNFLPTHEQIIKAFTNEQQWIDFCRNKEKPVFEFFNEEYLNAFADYFVDKIKEYGASKNRPLVILEIGAGNGRLSHFLQKKLDERAPQQTKVIATDSGKLNLKNDFPVEKLKHDEAMEKYNPDIVICSWMPIRQDFSKDIRNCDSVREYILIGEVDTGCCGDKWETWGYASSWDENAEKTPPYVEDGFEREDLHEFTELQISSSDDWRGPTIDSASYFNSRTVSFKKKKL